MSNEQRAKIDELRKEVIQGRANERDALLELMDILANTE